MQLHDDIKILIVDDEPIARNIIRKYLEDKESIEILDECSNGKDALQTINIQNPDLVFLDIQMPDLDGISMLKALNDKNQPLFIFTTAYDHYAIEAFNLNALDYLLKPFDQERFDKAIEKAIKFLNIDKSDTLSGKLQKFITDYENLTKKEKSYLESISVKHQNKIRFVSVEEIHWIEAAGDYIKIHCQNQCYLLDSSMNKIEQQLNPKSFLRIHRSYLLNKKEIKEIEPFFNGEYYIYLKNRIKLKSSRSYKNVIRQLINN